MVYSKTSNGLKKVRYSRRPQRRRKAQKKRIEQQKVVIGQANLDRNDRRGIGQQRVTLSQLILPKPSQSGKKDQGEVKIKQKSRDKKSKEEAERMEKKKEEKMKKIERKKEKEVKKQEENKMQETGKKKNEEKLSGHGHKHEFQNEVPMPNKANEGELKNDIKAKQKGTNKKEDKIEKMAKIEKNDGEKGEQKLTNKLANEGISNEHKCQRQNAGNVKKEEKSTPKEKAEEKIIVNFLQMENGQEPEIDMDKNKVEAMKISKAKGDEQKKEEEEKEVWEMMLNDAKIEEPNQQNENMNAANEEKEINIPPVENSQEQKMELNDGQLFQTNGSQQKEEDEKEVWEMMLNDAKIEEKPNQQIEMNEANKEEEIRISPVENGHEQEIEMNNDENYENEQQMNIFQTNVARDEHKEEENDVWEMMLNDAKIGELANKQNEKINGTTKEEEIHLLPMENGQAQEVGANKEANNQHEQQMSISQTNGDAQNKEEEEKDVWEMMLNDAKIDEESNRQNEKMNAANEELKEREKSIECMMASALTENEGGMEEGHLDEKIMLLNGNVDVVVPSDDCADEHLYLTIDTIKQENGGNIEEDSPSTKSSVDSGVEMVSNGNGYGCNGNVEEAREEGGKSNQSSPTSADENKFEKVEEEAEEKKQIDREEDKMDDLEEEADNKEDEAEAEDVDNWEEAEDGGPEAKLMLLEKEVNESGDQKEDQQQEEVKMSRWELINYILAKVVNFHGYFDAKP